MAAPACGAPSSCCRFSIPAEGPENRQRPLGVLSRQATQRDGREAKTGKQSCLPFTELSSAKMSLGMEPQGKHLPLCPIISWVFLHKVPHPSFPTLYQPPPRWPWSLGYLLFFQASTTPLDCLPRRTIVHENSSLAPANPSMHYSGVVP